MCTCRICVIRIFVGFPEKFPHPMLSLSGCSFCNVTNNTCSSVVLFLSTPRFPITQVIHAGLPNLPGRFSGAELKIARPVLLPVCAQCPRSMHSLNDCRWECLLFLYPAATSAQQQPLSQTSRYITCFLSCPMEVAPPSPPLSQEVRIKSRVHKSLLFSSLDPFIQLTWVMVTERNPRVSKQICPFTLNFFISIQHPFIMCSTHYILMAQLKIKFYHVTLILVGFYCQPSHPCQEPFMKHTFSILVNTYIAGFMNLQVNHNID